MTENQNQESQQEFFGEFSRQAEKPEHLPTLARSQKPLLISATSEQILVACILLILALCGIFFLGVMRGKDLSRLTPVPAPAAATVKSAAPLPVQEIRPRAMAATAPAAPAALVKAPQTRPAIGDASKPYTIQLVTHKKKEYAEAELQSLKQRGISAFIVPRGDYFLVCYGQYANKESAKKDLAAFRARYKDCFLGRR